MRTSKSDAVVAQELNHIYVSVDQNYHKRTPADDDFIVDIVTDFGITCRRGSRETKHEKPTQEGNLHPCGQPCNHGPMAAERENSSSQHLMAIILPSHVGDPTSAPSARQSKPDD